MRKSLIVVAAAALALGADSKSQSQGEPTVEALYSSLVAASTTDSAATQIRQLAEKSGAARRYVADRLPDCIKTKDGGEVWVNCVRLAGELKAAEAIPALTEAIQERNVGGEITMARVFRLDNDPAGKALAAIGDAVVPAISKVLDTGDDDSRWRAVYILAYMNSEKSRQAMREHLGSEKNPHLRDLIRRQIAHRTGLEPQPIACPKANPIGSSPGSAGEAVAV